MRTEDAFPGKYLKSSDAKPKPLVAVISHVEMEMVGQGQDQKRKPVLHFEDQKPLVLNRTNFQALVDAFGDSDDWPGNKVKLRSARTPTHGSLIFCAPEKFGLHCSFRFTPRTRSLASCGETWMVYFS